MKLFRKIAVFLLTLVLVSGVLFTELPMGSLLPTALAADSPVNAPVTPEETVTVVPAGDGSVGVKVVDSDRQTVVIPRTVTVDGKVYRVTQIQSGAINKKYNKVIFKLNRSTKIGSKILKTKKAKKTKKIVIEAENGQKLKASQFDKEAFKGYKGKITIKKSSMTKKEFKKLVKKLKKGGFKGKIQYK